MNFQDFRAHYRPFLMVGVKTVRVNLVGVSIVGVNIEMYHTS
jgi:hypothetical protein